MGHYKGVTRRPTYTALGWEYERGASSTSVHFTYLEHVRIELAT